MLKYLNLLFLLILCTACEIDYNFNSENRSNQVVVNSLITPNKPFQLQLNWSKRYSDGGKYAPIADAEVDLYENGKHIYNGKTNDQGACISTFVAQKNCEYKVKIIIPNFGEVWAETSIPDLPDTYISFDKKIGSYFHFDIKQLIMPKNSCALWIDGVRKYKDSYRPDRIEEIYSFNTSSIFVDQVNGSNDTYEAQDKGSTVSFEHFLRITKENSLLATPLHFSVFGGSADNILFRIITASGEYDKYMRSRYKQSLNSDVGAEGNPFIEQITVYSNIHGGTGIFAGYNYIESLQL